VIVSRDGHEQTLQLTVGVGKPTGTPVVAVSKQSDVAIMQLTSQKTRRSPVIAKSVVSDGRTTGDESSLGSAGLRLENLSETERHEIASKEFPGARKPVRYNGGLRIVSVRAGSVASRFVNDGDILLGLDGFETLGPTNISYILEMQESAIQHQ
jgi:hypothetical protein